LNVNGIHSIDKVKVLDFIKPKLEFPQNDFNINSINNLNEELNLDNKGFRDYCSYSNYIFENLGRMIKEQN